MANLFTLARKSATTIASASTISLPTDGDRADVSGTTTITAIDTTGFSLGARVWLRFLGACEIENSSNLILNSGTNYTTTAGDALLFEVIGTNQVQELAPPVSNGGGSGTVTSVAVTVPSDQSVSGSPITTSGTIAITDSTQSANKVKAGPASGSAAAPTFRSLVAADLATGTPATGDVPVVQSDGSVAWETGSGSGDVTGPGSSVAHHIAGFADTTGELLEDSGHGYIVERAKQVNDTLAGSAGFHVGDLFELEHQAIGDWR